METWFIRDDGLVENSKGRTLPIEKIQDQIDDGRIQLMTYEKAIEKGLIKRVWDFLNTPIGEL